MKYAFIEEGVVTNMIWLNPQNESEFPSAVSPNGLIIRIGDTYEDGCFYRDGKKVISELEEALLKIAELEAERVDMRAALAELGVTNDE